MKKKPVYLLMTMALAISCIHSFSQDTSSIKRYKVAIFTPLYLDSAFDATSSYRLGMNFPKYFNPGLEFYEGAQKAIDSLKKEGLALNVYVYDSRSSKSSVNSVISTAEFDSMDLVIGQVNASEARTLADAVAKRNIPFINATYPNDAGVSNNPDFVILNSTLQTHCAAIYKFIQKYYALSPIIFFSKKETRSDALKTYFEEISKTTASVPLNIKYITLQDNFTPEDLKKYLRANGNTVCIAGNLNVEFGTLLTQQLASLYADRPSVVFAMPTWWDVTNFAKPEFKGIEVIYSTPFYLSPTQKLVTDLQNEFRTKFYSRPTDMFFRGYETLYHFAHLLVLNGKNLGSSLADKRFNVFTDFDIQPVINSKTTTLDYFENKKIYFVKKVDGVAVAVY